MHLKYIYIAFHNGSNYHYHFIIKELSEEFKKQFTCLRESTEKCIIFTVPIENKVTRIDRNGAKNISYILQFIHSTTTDVKLVELHMKYATVLLNTKILNII